MKTWNELDTFTRAYITAAFWTWNEVEPPGGVDYRDTGCAQEHFSNLAESTLEQIEKDCAEFQSKYAGLLREAGDAEQNGHDFSLTRNRNGVGFWDRGYDKTVGDGLTAAAHSFGESYLYTGDGGKIYC